MAGNLWEWVADWYDAEYFSNSPEMNPQGPENGVKRVIRGGSYYMHQQPQYIRTTMRYNAMPDFPSLTIGFRCAVSHSDIDQAAD